MLLMKMVDLKHSHNNGTHLRELSCRYPIRGSLSAKQNRHQSDLGSGWVFFKVIAQRDHLCQTADQCDLQVTNRSPPQSLCEIMHAISHGQLLSSPHTRS